MARKKKEKVEGEIVKLEKVEKKKKSNFSAGFYYLLGIAISVILVFATQKFLSTINYLFVIIFAIIAVIKIISFIMDRDYEIKDYSDMIMAIISAWIAMFVFKYGQFLFLEILPILVSLLLFAMATSSLTKYFDYHRIANLVLSISSLILGILLIFVPASIVYIVFKITGVYLFVTIILDFIDYRHHK